MTEVRASAHCKLVRTTQCELSERPKEKQKTDSPTPCFDMDAYAPTMSQLVSHFQADTRCEICGQKGLTVPVWEWYDEYVDVCESCMDHAWRNRNNASSD